MNITHGNGVTITFMNITNASNKGREGHILGEVAAWEPAHGFCRDEPMGLWILGFMFSAGCKVNSLKLEKMLQNFRQNTKLHRLRT